MRLGIMRQAEQTRAAALCARDMPAFRRTGAFATFVACITLQAFAGGSLLAGQASAPPNTEAAPAKPAAPVTPKNSAKKPSKSHANLAAAQPVPTPAAAPPPAAPPPPNWPANDRPSDAKVTWDSHGLQVVAANSSLEQIMKAISTQTGATLEGLSKDERVFGIYGPGPARDVISQLLDGTGYNVLMIGDQGQGTPRQIILTSQSGAAPAAPNAGNRNTSNDEENEADEQAQQPEPPPPQEQPPALPNGSPPGVPVRSQQQIIEQLQERQREIQQQQQQQNQQ
jgi:hypothetical protein